MVAMSTDTIALDSNRATIPVLGRVCRQIGREYCDIFTAIAPKVARNVVMLMGVYGERYLLQIIQRLPELLSDPERDVGEAKRFWTFVINVPREISTFVANPMNHTGNWVTSVSHLTFWDWAHKLVFRLAFDTTDFPFQSCRDQLLKQIVIIRSKLTAQGTPAVTANTIPTLAATTYSKQVAILKNLVEVMGGTVDEGKLYLAELRHHKRNRSD